MPRIMPCRRRSNGRAASSTTSSVAAAPVDEEAGAEPLEQVVAGHVVGRHDDDAPAATGADPVLRQRDRLRGAGARGVHLRVRAARADQLGELRVAHGEDAEQEAAVERVGLPLERRAAVVDEAVHLGRQDVVAVGRLVEPGAQPLEEVELLAPRAVGVIARSGRPTKAS